MRRNRVRFLIAMMAVAMCILAGAPVQAGPEDLLKGPPPLIGGEVKYRVDKSNVEQYKDKLPDGLYHQIKDWNRAIDVYDTVHDYRFPKEYLEATEKFKGTARVNEKGGLDNYTAGLPFPDPKTGIEVMYNYDRKYNGDDYTIFDTDFYCYSPTGKYRKLVGGYHRIQFQGRLIVDPKPAIENGDGLQLKEVQWLNYPEDVAGLALLTARYRDADKGDDGWMYIPTIRRVRRISVAQRSDSFGGSDLTWDDYLGFSGKVSDYTWKLVGKKEMLVPSHAVTWQLRHKEGLPDSKDLRYELRPVIVVEGANKSKDYLYSKRVIYLDPDSWYISGEDMYDKRGTLWKYLEIPWAFDPRNHNNFAFHYGMYDLQARRSTIICLREKQDGPLQVVNTGFKEEMFSPSYIQTWGR